MSDDPPRRRPPRQDRWPNATPQEGWPAYSARGDHRQTAGGYEGGAAGGYWNGRAWGYGGGAAGYGGARDGGYDDQDDYDSYGDYGDYDGVPDDYDGVPDDFARDRDRDRAGLVAGAAMGLLAAGVTTGAATLAAAFVRPQASPVIALGGVLTDRVPPGWNDFTLEHFGESDKTMLLLGMYVVITLLAMVIGCLARRNAAIGVGGIAAFSLLGAFVAITGPQSRPVDVLPSVIGGLAGIAVFAWLAHATAPPAIRHAHAGGRRRAR